MSFGSIVWSFEERFGFDDIFWAIGLSSVVVPVVDEVVVPEVVAPLFEVVVVFGEPAFVPCGLP